MKVKLHFTSFDVPNWELVIKKADINDKLLMKQIRSNGIRNRNIHFALCEEENYYTVFAMNTAAEPLGNIIIEPCTEK